MIIEKPNCIMFGKQVILTFLSCLILSFSYGQESWSLQKCVNYARENSLNLKLADYAIQDAKLLEQRAKNLRLPGVNGTATGGLQFGRTIDPTTNSFDNQTIGFNNLGINASATIYDGGTTKNTIKQSKINTKAALLDSEASYNILALNIANTYLSILNAEEQLKNSKKRLDLSTEQLDRTDKLINAGTLPKNDRLNVLAQMARDEQSIIQSQNAIETNYLILKQFLDLDPNTDIKIELPDLAKISSQVNPDNISFREVYAAALGTQPQVEADKLRLESSDVNVDLAKAGMLPTLIIFGGLDTRWSSVGKKVVGTEDVTNLVEVEFMGQTGEIGFPGTNFILGDNPYGDQLSENFGQNVGLQLSVPIYSRGFNKIAMQRAEVGIKNAQVQSEQTLNSLKTDVQNAIAQARAAKLSQAATQKTMDAAQAAFDNAQKRFDLGAINTFDLTTARNNLDIAQTDAIVAKYEYIFRLKVLDFYQGRPMTLD
jgi:outer membrane protein